MVSPLMPAPAHSALVHPTAPVAAATATAPPHDRSTDLAGTAVPSTSRPGTDEALRLRENLQEALKALSEQMDDGARQLSFSVDEALGRTVVKVHDRDSGEVVRQIPSEAVLKVAHTLHDLKGLLLDQRG